MACATFRRQPEADGSSITRIKEEVRRDIARDLLRSGNLHIEQIAMSLGFSGGKSLNRAFLKWTGETPTAYRHRFVSARNVPLSTGEGRTAA